MAMKYVKKFNKKGISSEIVNLLTINERDFLYRLNADDAVVLIGGDGTYHQFFNHIYPLKPKCRVFALSCGRGNDFARDYKKKKMFEITHLICAFRRDVSFAIVSLFDVSESLFQ